MKKQRIRTILDYLPLIILTVSAVILVANALRDGTGFLWQHIVGFMLLPINYFLFSWKHKIGVLGLGLTLILGLVGVLSYSQAILISKLSFGGIPIFYGQPIFLLWLLIHFIVSGRHYFAILTKKYWQNVMEDKGNGVVTHQN